MERMKEQVRQQIEANENIDQTLVTGRYNPRDNHTFFKKAMVGVTDIKSMKDKLA